MPPWLVEEFEALNRAHFDGKLPPIFIAVQKTVTATPAALHSSQGVSPVIFIHPAVAAQDRRWLRDSLLHELVHYALIVETGDGDMRHGEAFVGRANAIGQTLGVEAVPAGTDEAQEWPQSVRGRDYPRWTGIWRMPFSTRRPVPRRGSGTIG
jgi:SprT-like family